jgi:hypothetical protein
VRAKNSYENSKKISLLFFTTVVIRGGVLHEIYYATRSTIYCVINASQSLCTLNKLSKMHPPYMESSNKL